MPEQVQKIIDQIIEWWGRFNTKQRILLSSIVATLLLALALLVFVVSRPNMVLLHQCANTLEAGQVKDLLDSDSSITYEVSQDGLTFYVNEKNEAAAAILLGRNGIPTAGFTIQDVVDGGFSTTEADKTKLYKTYLEERFADHLESLSNVESAYVDLDITPDDGTIFARQQDSYAAVILTLSAEMSDDQALGIAKYVATQIGNDSTDHILILDSNSNVLFSGGDSSSAVGAASTQLSLQAKRESMVRSQVKDVLVGSGLYDHAEVALNLAMDFSQTRETTREWYAPEGQTNGMIGQESEFTSSSVNGPAAEPGTGSNDDTTYVIQDNEYAESEVTDRTTTYQNNEKVTDRTAALGEIDYSASSITVVLTDYVIYDEDALRASGVLEDMTFDEYIVANSEKVQVDVPDDRYTMISNATGFPEANISIIAYTQPLFEYSSGQRTLSDYLQIILAVLILLLLGFVVFRSTRKEKEPEVEEELSVESLLESTRETQDSLEDIGFTEKSETRLLIEKFVEENPEAAASLLRNWLNEEWE